MVRGSMTKISDHQTPNPPMQLIILSMEVDDDDSFECEYILRIESDVKYLIISYIMVKLSGITFYIRRMSNILSMAINRWQGGHSMARDVAVRSYGWKGGHLRPPKLRLHSRSSYSTCKWSKLNIISLMDHKNRHARVIPTKQTKIGSAIVW